MQSTTNNSWCGHCIKAAPLYAQAATKLLPQRTAKVDCVAHKRT
jgi:thiol-disulfide isomerase/thioredoxin